MLGSRTLASPVEDLQAGWEIANYQLTEEAQTQAFKSLIERSDMILKRNPNNPDLLIWYAIIHSTYAGTTGGFSALRLVKTAKKALEKAIEIDGHALQGSAYTSLGSLYA